MSTYLDPQFAAVEPRAIKPVDGVISIALVQVPNERKPPRVAGPHVAGNVHVPQLPAAERSKRRSGNNTGGTQNRACRSR